MSASSDFVALGPDAAIDIGAAGGAGPWLAFAVISGGYRYRGDRAETSDSESGVHKRHKVGNSQLEVNCEAQLATDVMYATTYALTPRSVVAIRIWTLGRGNNDGLWQADRFAVEGDDGNFAVRGSQPQTVRIDGVSDGPIVFPGGF